MGKDFQQKRRCRFQQDIYSDSENHIHTDGAKHCNQHGLRSRNLHRDLEEVIYMQQLEGFIEEGNKNMLCWLRKSLYGLKLLPTQWYEKFEPFMIEHDFDKKNANHYVFVDKYDGRDFLILLFTLTTC